MEGLRPGTPPLPFLDDVPGMDKGDEWDEDDDAAEEAIEMLWPVAGESHRQRRACQLSRFFFEFCVISYIDSKVFQFINFNNFFDKMYSWKQTKITNKANVSLLWRQSNGHDVRRGAPCWKWVRVLALFTFRDKNFSFSYFLLLPYWLK